VACFKLKPWRQRVCEERIVKSLLEPKGRLEMLFPGLGGSAGECLAAAAKLQVNVEGGFGPNWEAQHLDVTRLLLTAADALSGAGLRGLAKSLAGGDALPVNRASRAFKSLEPLFDHAGSCCPVETLQASCSPTNYMAKKKKKKKSKGSNGRRPLGAPADTFPIRSGKSSGEAKAELRAEAKGEAKGLAFFGADGVAQAKALPRPGECKQTAPPEQPRGVAGAKAAFLDSDPEASPEEDEEKYDDNDAAEEEEEEEGAGEEGGTAPPWLRAGLATVEAPASPKGRGAKAEGPGAPRAVLGEGLGQKEEGAPAGTSPAGLGWVGPERWRDTRPWRPRTLTPLPGSAQTPEKTRHLRS